MEFFCAEQISKLHFIFPYHFIMRLHVQVFI